MTETVTPPNRSLLEAALDLATGEVIERIVPPFPALMDPMATPVDFLPYLAADRGVTDWDPAAPVSERRLTTALAWGIKRQAGTRTALLQAVESMELGAKSISWYEQRPRGEPYSFVLEATVNRPWILSDFPRLWRRVNDAKSERDTLELRLVTETSGPLGAAGAVNQPVSISDMSLTGRLPEYMLYAPAAMAGGVDVPVAVSDLDLAGVLPENEIFGSVGSAGGVGEPLAMGDLDLAGVLPESELRGSLYSRGTAQTLIIDDHDLKAAE